MEAFISEKDIAKKSAMAKQLISDYQLSVNNTKTILEPNKTAPTKVYIGKFGSNPAFRKFLYGGAAAKKGTSATQAFAALLDKFSDHGIKAPVKLPPKTLTANKILSKRRIVPFSEDAEFITIDGAKIHNSIELSDDDIKAKLKAKGVSNENIPNALLKAKKE